MLLRKRLILTPVILLILLLGGCRKIIEEVLSGNDSQEKPGVTQCNVQEIIYTETGVVPTWITDTVKFEYNEAGNPVSVKHSLLTTAYSDGLDKVFKYDSDGRLLAFINQINPSTNSAVEWHVYSYPSRNTIIDSNFVRPMGDWTDSYRPDDGFVYVSFYQLDDKGRIVKETYHWLDEFETNYVYGTDGNLIVPGVQYDKGSFNIKATNKVWQFISKDYSVNNTVTNSAVVNNYNYPERINTWENFVGMFDVNKADGIVSYNCSDNPEIR